MSIEHIVTNFMIADLLIKGLISKVFYEHVAHMSIVSADDVQF
jgi:hypothetical protein